MRRGIVLFFIFFILSFKNLYAKKVNLNEINSEYIELRFELRYDERSSVYIFHESGKGYISNKNNKKMKFSSFVEINSFLESYNYNLVTLYIKGDEVKEYIMIYKRKNYNLKHNNNNSIRC